MRIFNNAGLGGLANVAQRIKHFALSCPEPTSAIATGPEKDSARTIHPPDQIESGPWHTEPSPQN